MALFAKATILLNGLVLILCLVYLHKRNMKDGKYWSEKTARDKKQNSIKKNVEWPRYVPHTLQPFGSRLALENPPDGPAEMPDLQALPAAILVVLQAWLQGFWGVSFTDCSVANVLCQAGEGWVRPCRLHPELCESRTGTKWHTVSVSLPERDAEVAEFASKGLAASSHFICLSETVRATKAWTTSVRSSSFSLLLARK